MEMSVEQIALTLPGDDAFHGVAHLVLGGVATRNDLTVETLEDLTLALDTVLDLCGESVGEVTVLARIGDHSAVLEVGPFPTSSLAPVLEHGSRAALDTRRILDTVANEVELVERDDGEWLRVTKTVERVRSEDQ
jgi:hypothetical protein